MKYTLVRTNWRFHVNGDVYNVGYNGLTNSWYVNHNRKTLYENIGDPYNGTNEQIEFYLNQGVERKKLMDSRLKV